MSTLTGHEERERLVQPGSGKTHVLTIGLEDYYHGATFNRLIPRGHWHRFEPRLERSTQATLALLDEYGIKATFFALGWVADKMPELIREVVARGHDLASKGYYHRHIRDFSRGEFREDLARAREALERAGGRRIVGYRVAQLGLSPVDLWALDVLAEEGYEFDSSLRPTFRAYESEPWRRFVHRHEFAGRTLWEFPVSSASILGWHVPIAGANYFRQFPHALVQRGVRGWDREYPHPFVMYFHTWELDPEQPRITAAPMYARVRQYRNLDRMGLILRHYFERYRFTSIASYLGLATAEALVPAQHEAARQSASRSSGESHLPEYAGRTSGPTALDGGESGFDPAVDTSAAGHGGSRTLVSVVVPCYNEELILPYLANTLAGVEVALAARYEFRFVLVDDGSHDGTWAAMQRLFGDRPNFTMVRHPHNKGVAAGVMTGIQHATTEIVCSIDCDCTYDPRELAKMVPMLAPGVDVVTASPYHPNGRVLNVPGWRLFLSKGVTQLYRLVLHQKLCTYTACFRVYRRSAVIDIPLERTGFIGVTELLGRLDLAGSRIAEYPTTLEVRILGRSKMRILRTIIGHLVLLQRLAWLRMTAPAPHPRPVPRVGTPATATAGVGEVVDGTS